MKTPDNVYSASEMKLIKYFKMESYINCPAPDIYRIMVTKAFVDNDTTTYADALRKVANALLIKGTPYRMTKEFDSLIESSLNAIYKEA